MTDAISPDRNVPRRGWLIVAAAGCLLVALTFLVVLLVIVDKDDFGSLVGRYFLHFITSAIFIGSLLLAVATWNLPIRRTWRGIFLFAWALIALTSPLFGFLFLLPWGVLALSLPVVVWILGELFRDSRPARP